MARKRPPGAKKRQPTPRQPSTSPALDRMMSSLVLAYSPEEYAPAVVTALRDLLEHSTFHPPLLENYSLFIMGVGDDNGPVAITAYRLDEQADMLMSWLEHHEQAHRWQLEVPDNPEPLRLPHFEA